MAKFLHTCPNGPACSLTNDASHCSKFVHPTHIPVVNASSPSHGKPASTAQRNEEQLQGLQPTQRNQEQPTHATQKSPTPCKHGDLCLNINPSHLKKHSHPPRPICSKVYNCNVYSPEHRIQFAHPTEFHPSSASASFYVPAAQPTQSPSTLPANEDQFDEDMQKEFSQGGWWNGHEFVNGDDDYEEEYEEETEFDEAAYLRFLEEEAQALEEESLK
eukprot:TRINITY_DN17292_c0_g1_i1.p1 TRINITY_DN17292_c0_g1~~TRINITY_DN17292_c0_g1_i1.p1  ORF type:complete len:217 (-),score=47.93 TRINITY_DN17292_c0_g1_i1:166-816(-)